MDGGSAWAPLEMRFRSLQGYFVPVGLALDPVEDPRAVPFTTKTRE